MIKNKFGQVLSALLIREITTVASSFLIIVVVVLVALGILFRDTIQLTIDSVRSWYDLMETPTERAK